MDAHKHINTTAPLPSFSFIHFNWGLSFHLGVNEILDVLHPGLVLALLLHVHVVGDKDGESLGDAALLEVALEKDLEILVEATEGRARVDVLGGVGDLGGVAVRVARVLEVVEVLDHDLAVLRQGLDVQRALAGLLHHDVQAERHGRLVTLLALDTVLLGSIGLGLGLATLRGVEVLVSQGLIIEALLRLEVGDIGDREGNGDAELFNGSLETKPKDRTERRKKKERKRKEKSSI